MRFRRALSNVAARFVFSSLLGKGEDFLDAGGEDAFIFKIRTTKPRKRGGSGRQGKQTIPSSVRRRFFLFI